MRRLGANRCRHPRLGPPVAGTPLTGDIVGTMLGSSAGAFRTLGGRGPAAACPPPVALIRTVDPTGAHLYTHDTRRSVLDVRRGAVAGG